MSYYDADDIPKAWNNKCPKCKSEIRWSLINRRKGAKSNVHCSNNINATFIDIKDFKKIKICNWTGYVVRQKDGGVRFANANGTWLRES